MFHVKHQDSVRLVELAHQHGIALQSEHADVIMRFTSCVIRSPTNVTAVTELSEALRLHALDSLTALPEITAAPDGPLLDLGTGGGFPGVPLGVVTGRETVLLDSVKKKLVAVDACLAAVGISGVRTHWGRAEEYPELSSFSVVTARAVAALPTLVELAAPLLSHGGRLIAFKGRLAQTEIGRGDTAAAKCGLRREGIRAFELTETGEARTLVTYRRVGDPSLALPRRVGMASKQPLA